jgi:hypothetical protein
MGKEPQAGLPGPWCSVCKGGMTSDSRAPLFCSQTLFKPHPNQERPDPSSLLSVLLEKALVRDKSDSSLANSIPNLLIPPDDHLELLLGMALGPASQGSIGDRDTKAWTQPALPLSPSYSPVLCPYGLHYFNRLKPKSCRM